MSWRLAQSLITLRDEIDSLAPHRNRASDGTLGDRAHRARASRHNPNYAGVVTALDITHDPGSGVDVHRIARDIAQAPHPECAYIISDRMVAGRHTNWRWVSYHGSNPHVAHAHFAVGEGPDSDPRPPYDSTAPWLTVPFIEEDDMAERLLALIANGEGKGANVYISDGFKKRQIGAGAENVRAWADAGAATASNGYKYAKHPTGAYVLSPEEIREIPNA